MATTVFSSTTAMVVVLVPLAPLPHLVLLVPEVSAMEMV
jgi:hypothetical protein